MVGDTDLSLANHTEAEGRMGVLGEVLEMLQVLFEFCVDNPLFVL